MNPKKPVAVFLGGALIAVIGTHEARENPHVERRQYEEAPRLTQELVLSTATGSHFDSLLPHDFQPIKVKITL
jgi:hypothetical protein